MRNPPCEIQERSSGRQVQRVIRKSCEVKIIPDMIQRHDDHSNTANDVDGFNSLFSVGQWLLHVLGFRYLDFKSKVT